MKEPAMFTVESTQEPVDPLFPELMGVRLTEVAPERIVAQLAVTQTQTQRVPD